MNNYSFGSYIVQEENGLFKRGSIVYFELFYPCGLKGLFITIEMLTASIFNL